MAALDALARLLVEDPRPEHAVLGWFDTTIALRLADVGLVTIGQLVTAINAAGYRWYRAVPRLGEVGARRIVAWLAHYESVADLRLTPAAHTHPRDQQLPAPRVRRAPATTIAPRGFFVAPPELDGAHRNLIKNHSGARNDEEAIAFWLGDFEGERLREQYRSEAERLRLWAIFERKKALSSLTIDDARDYLNGFLPDPPAAWIMTRAVPRDAPDWRPFRGPLHGEPAGRAGAPEKPVPHVARGAVPRSQPVRESEGVSPRAMPPASSGRSRPPSACKSNAICLPRLGRSRWGCWPSRPTRRPPRASASS
ncbi:phage integrase family protein [Burkholderia alba]|uniref:phage integrase family protein n=1 Tax=Burkholderia alba TaxID=2683677 RepID=UPI002B053EB8|nr:phage integrase family protein [Burkholderia alba]